MSDDKKNPVFCLICQLLLLFHMCPSRNTRHMEESVLHPVQCTVCRSWRAWGWPKAAVMPLHGGSSASHIV